MATASWLATPARPVRGQLDQVPHGRGRVHDVPLLEGALATMECTTVAVHPGGDHAIVLGEVVDLQLPAVAGDALVFYRGQYGSLS